MKHVLCSNGSWIDGNSEVGFMTLISAYIELFIRGKSPGGEMSGGNVRIPNTIVPIQYYLLLFLIIDYHNVGFRVEYMSWCFDCLVEIFQLF